MYILLNIVYILLKACLYMRSVHFCILVGSVVYRIFKSGCIKLVLFTNIDT